MDVSEALPQPTGDMAHWRWFMALLVVLAVAAFAFVQTRPTHTRPPTLSFQEFVNRCADRPDGPCLPPTG